MTGPNPEPEHAEAVHKPTPTQAFRELAMAYATKTQRAATPATEAGTFSSGALQGQVYLKSHVLVQGDGEEWPQFIGRYEAELRALLEVNASLNEAHAGQAVPAGGAA